MQTTPMIGPAINHLGVGFSSLGRDLLPSWVFPLFLFFIWFAGFIFVILLLVALLGLLQQLVVCLDGLLELGDLRIQAHDCLLFFCWSFPGSFLNHAVVLVLCKLHQTLRCDVLDFIVFVQLHLSPALKLFVFAAFVTTEKVD